MIQYVQNAPLNVEQFIGLLSRSALGARRPTEPDRLNDMLNHANLIISAWDGQVLVGIARSLTDFAYCCYLSDLAVDEAYQQQGIGKALIRHTAHALAPDCQIILLAASAATEYYPHLGFDPHPSAWYKEAQAFL